MQPVEAQKGVSTKSQLFHSLKVYLNNQKRLQPIIGLGSIIECVKADTHNREVLYLCEVCVCRLSKADMRNHIMGSLHRYNYIKAWHPHLLSDWKEQSDLSKLAWPLMEMAKILEGKEGPGEVQCLDVEDALFQKMATHSENDAVTLITILRDGQGEPWSHSETKSVQLEHNPIQSQRIVLLSPNQQRQCQKSLKTSAETSRSAEGWLSNTSPEPSMLPENHNSFLDGYTGTKPLIGLCRMLECRSEDGRTCCFLCHCCRIRSNKKDIIDHLTRSSHLMNYLMEIHPEQVEVMMADINDNYQLLQSLAKKVEREEGRGELEVVNAPESLCSLLTGKSYHWCVKVLCNGWTSTNIQKQKIAVKGPSVNKTANQGRPKGCAVVLSRLEKRMLSKRKNRKVRNTVFNVSLPLNKGSLLLERTSFSTDSLPVSTAYSPPSDSDLIPLPEVQPENRELDCDTESFTSTQAENASQLQKILYSGDSDAVRYMKAEKNITFTVYQEDGYFNNQYFNQSEDTTGRKYQKVDGKKLYNGQHSPQENSSARFYKEWQNEGPQTKHEWLSAAVSHPQDWSSNNSSYGHGAGCTEQWYNSTSQSKVGTRGQNEMSSNAAQQYYQQPQNQYMAQGHASLQKGSAGQQGLSGDIAAHSDARVNMYPYLVDPLAHSDGVKLEPRMQFPEFEQRQMQTYMEFTIGHFQPASHSYMTQATAHQDIQVSHGMMSNPNYNTGPGTNHDQHFPHPVSVWGRGGGGCYCYGGGGSYGCVSGNSGGGYSNGCVCGGGGMSQSDAVIPSGQAPR